MPVLTKINTNSIADDAITAEKYALEASGYVANSTNQDISGTYSDNRMYTSDAYTLSGNATVNGNLTLSTVKPTGDIVLTASGAYTITGTGTLSAGSIHSKNNIVTGMTGELGSAVTGSPALNLSNVTGTLAQARINQPAFSVWSSDSNQSTAGSQWITWGHNQADLDNKGGVHQDDYYLVQSGDDGYWVLIGTVHWGGSLSGTCSVAGGIFHNSTEIHSVWMSPTYDGGDNIACNVQATVNASVGSKFYLKGWENSSGSAVMMNGTDRNTTFMGFKLLI